MSCAELALFLKLFDMYFRTLSASVEDSGNYRVFKFGKKMTLFLSDHLFCSPISANPYCTLFECKKVGVTPLCGGGWRVISATHKQFMDHDVNCVHSDKLPDLIQALATLFFTSGVLIIETLLIF